MATWRCKAKKTWPIGPDSAWDGDNAAQALFEHFGFEGGEPDLAIKGCFLAVDTDNPQLRGSYKLPFCDLVDGEVMAMPAGIRAAASRLPQTKDFPDEEAAIAREVLDAYEAEMGSNGVKASGVMAASARIQFGAQIDPKMLPVTVDVFPLDIPSVGVPGTTDKRQQTNLPYVMPSDVVARCGKTALQMPIRVADNLKIHDEVRGGRMQPAPIYGMIQNYRIMDRDGVPTFVVDGYLWTYQIPPKLLAEIKVQASDGTLGSSAEWNHLYVDREDARYCEDFTITGLAILSKATAAFGEMTHFDMAASAETNELETDMSEDLAPKPAVEDVVEPEVVAEAAEVEAAEVEAEAAMPMVEDEPCDDAEDMEAKCAPDAKAAATLDDVMAVLNDLANQMATLMSMMPSAETVEDASEIPDMVDMAMAADDAAPAEELAEDAPAVEASTEEVVESEAAEAPEVTAEDAATEEPAEEAPAADVEAGAGMTIEQKVAAGVPITADELKEYGIQVRAALADMAPDGSLAPDVCATAVEAEVGPVALSPEDVARLKRAAREEASTRVVSRLGEGTSRWLDKYNGAV